MEVKCNHCLSCFCLIGTLFMFCVCVCVRLWSEGGGEGVSHDILLFWFA